MPVVLTAGADPRRSGRADALAAGLVLLTLAAFSTKALFNWPAAVMTLLGLARLVRAPRVTLAEPAVCTLLTVFACLWLPMLLALPDAVEPARSARTVFGYLRFPLAGIYVVVALAEARTRRIVLLGSAGIATFWCADGLLQFLSGRNLLGYPYQGTQLSGMFHPTYRLGIVLAALAPLYLQWVRELGRRVPAAWLLAALFVVIVFLSGKRSAWIMFAFALAVWTLVQLRTSALRPGHALGAVIAAAALVALVGSSYAPIAARVDKTLELFSGDYRQMDSATAYRLPLWLTARNMALAHWVNGIGPRGYRYVYREYAGPGDFWIEEHGTTGQTHPHQMTLEIAAETGVIGLGGFAVALLLLGRRLGGCMRRDDAVGAAWLGCVLVAVFPLNAHLAFYGTYWSAFLWWLLPVALAHPNPRSAVAAANPVLRVQ
ncbi:MAG: O-antigen ligase family protein [Gammaproteobacteria bacterium]|nr:O-antigen ligase family protein [Gammaproteobacteria bacterium]